VQHDLYGVSNFTDCYWNAVNSVYSEYEAFFFSLEISVRRTKGGEGGWSDGGNIDDRIFLQSPHVLALWSEFP